MTRYLIVIVIALLAACTTSRTQTSQADGSASSATASGSAGAATETGEASPACADAFAPIADMEVGSLSDLGDIAEVDATIESCESVADWTAGVQGVIDGEINPATVRLLLDIRCSDPSTGQTAVCADLAAS